MLFSATPASIVLLILLGFTLLFTLLFVARARSGRLPTFRALPGMDRLRTIVSDVAETSQPIHVATGNGVVNTPSPTAETIASLLIAQRVAEIAAPQGSQVTATNGDIVAHLAVRGTIHQAYEQAALGGNMRSDQAQLVAQNTPTAYAAGVAARYGVEPAAASVVAGNYGPEALLIPEAGAAQGIPQIAAATSLAALPGLALSADHTLIGEELFAAEAYISQTSAPKARLLTHDALRWLIVVLLVVGLIIQFIVPNLLG